MTRRHKPWCRPVLRPLPVLPGAGLLDYGEGPVYRIRARRWFNGRVGLPDYCEGLVYQKGPVYRIVAKGRFTGRAGLPLHGPDWHGGLVYQGARLTAWAGLQEKGRFRAGLSINHPGGPKGWRSQGVQMGPPGVPRGPPMGPARAPKGLPEGPQNRASVS